MPLAIFTERSIAFYADVLAFEMALSVRFEWILHVGDFGAWPDAERVDRATRNHEGAGDFPRWFAEARAAPRPTVFIKSNHEDFEWLEERSGNEVLPGVTYLPNGHLIELGDRRSSICVGGIGGCFGPSDYERKARDLLGYAQRHYTSDQIELLCSRGRSDVLLLHDAPNGVVLVQELGDGHARRYVSQAGGLAEAIDRIRPRICFFGHHHVRVDTEVAGVRCIGLNFVGRSGNLVAIELEPGGGGFSILGEWPRPTTATKMT